MNWDWHSYPVLYLDLNIEKYQRTDNLKEVIESLFRDWEKSMGLCLHLKVSPCVSGKL